MASLLLSPPHLPLVAASILSADFARLGDECRAALDAGADLLHLDVMDGHFVPNLTMGPALCRSVRQALPGATLDVHLMVERPSDFVESFAQAGADHLTFHVETAVDHVALAQRIRDAGMTAGLAINPPTDLEQVLALVHAFDLILVMSVHPGFAGQQFISEVLAKAAKLRPHLRDDQRLEMDGGINAHSAPACRDAGCDVLVAASAIFGARNYGQAVKALRGSEPSVARRS